MSFDEGPIRLELRLPRRARAVIVRDESAPGPVDALELGRALTVAGRALARVGFEIVIRRPRRRWWHTRKEGR